VVDLRGFRDAVRSRLRAVGRTQQELARAVGLHPHVLSHKLNGRAAMLNARDIVAIATALAGWGALSGRRDVERLLALAEVPLAAVGDDAWRSGPLAALADDRAVPRDGFPPESRALKPQPPPAPLNALIGRAGELAAIAVALDESRLVTLTGPGGSGKTRLAVESAARLAARFVDGVAFAELASVHDTALAASVIARAVGLAPTSVGAAEADLGAALAERQVLIVVDNVEQLPGAGAVLARILHRAPGVRMLVTSRRALRVQGEHVVRVPPLALAAVSASRAEILAADAVQMFLQRARAAGSPVESDADLAAIAGICAAVDGLPLALELAAARITMLAPQDLMTALGQRLAVLTDRHGDRPHRQQSLRAALDWSYALLAPETGRFFERLGVFAGAFDAAAAGAVADPPVDEARAAELLQELAEHSLLSLRPGPEPTFRMLQVVREYAQSRLSEARQLEDALGCHLRWWTERTERLGERLVDAADAVTSRDAPELVRQSYDDILAALDFGAEGGAEVVEPAWRLIIATVRCLRRGLFPSAEAALRIDRLLRRGGGAPHLTPATRIAALTSGTALCCFIGDYRRGLALGADAVAAAEEHGDDVLTARALRLLGEAQRGVAEFAAAEASVRRARELATRAGDAAEIAYASNMLAEICWLAGNYQEARDAALHSMRQAHEAGRRYDVWTALHTLADILRDQGEHVRALRALRRLLGIESSQLVGTDLAYELESVAATVGRMGQSGPEVFTLLAVGRRIRAEITRPLPPPAARALDEAVAGADLDAAQRAAAEERGQQMPPEAAIALASELVSTALMQARAQAR
jgi:predicted ATPase